MIYGHVNPATHAEFIKRDLSGLPPTDHSDPMKRLWLMIALIAPPTWADFPDAVAAYDAGDYATALKEYLAMAEQGHADAQYMAGHLYAQGLGTPRDPVQAHLWFTLAAAQSDPFAEEALAELERGMTAAQIAEARALAAAWEPSVK
jgi:hypothetical protein